MKKEAKIDLSVIGIQGKNKTWNPNKGQIITFIDSSNNFICVDAFEGSGNSYKRRENSYIEVCHEGEFIFKGTFKELIEKLK